VKNYSSKLILTAAKMCSLFAPPPKIHLLISVSIYKDGGVLRTCVLRPCGIYGPEERRHLHRVMVSKQNKGHPLASINHFLQVTMGKNVHLAVSDASLVECAPV